MNKLTFFAFSTLILFGLVSATAQVPNPTPTPPDPLEQALMSDWQSYTTAQRHVAEDIKQLLSEQTELKKALADKQPPVEEKK